MTSRRHLSRSDHQPQPRPRLSRRAKRIDLRAAFESIADSSRMSAIPVSSAPCVSAAAPCSAVRRCSSRLWSCSGHHAAPHSPRPRMGMPRRYRAPTPRCCSPCENATRTSRAAPFIVAKSYSGRRSSSSLRLLIEPSFPTSHTPCTYQPYRLPAFRMCHNEQPPRRRRSERHDRRPRSTSDLTLRCDVLTW